MVVIGDSPCYQEIELATKANIPVVVVEGSKFNSKILGESEENDDGKRPTPGQKIKQEEEAKAIQENANPFGPAARASRIIARISNAVKRLNDASDNLHRNELTYVQSDLDMAIDEIETAIEAYYNQPVEDAS